MKRLTYILSLIILLSGCPTQYRNQGYWGKDGYAVTKIQDDIFKITVRYTGYSSSRMANFALLRCAETALANGYKYFVFLDERSLVIQCFREKPENVTAPVYDGEQVSKDLKNEHGLDRESKGK